MLDFTKEQTITGADFFAAWESNQRAETAYAEARYFVTASNATGVDQLIKYCRFIVFPYAVCWSKDWPYYHVRMEKREFRAWLKDSHIHTFCIYWESNRMMVITAFSINGESFWDYQGDEIVRVEKPANKKDFN